MILLKSFTVLVHWSSEEISKKIDEDMALLSHYVILSALTVIIFGSGMLTVVYGYSNRVSQFISHQSLTELLHIMDAEMTGISTSIMIKR